MAVKKLEYIVLKKGVSAELGGREYKIGETIKLTEQQAAARVNKVQLKSEATVAPGADKALADLTKQLDELQEAGASAVKDNLAAIEVLQTTVGKMTKERDEAMSLFEESEKETKKLATSLVKMTKERDELVKAQVK